MPTPTRSALLDAARYADTWLAHQQQFLRVPGVQAALLFGDEVVLSAAYGHADVEHDVPLTTEHRFRIASHSKTFTATAVMQLVERRRLRLDDPLEQWIPAAQGLAVGRVTVRELLAHAGGISRDGDDGDFWQLHTPFLDDAALDAVLGANPLVLARNERFKYSNIGYSLLGRVVAAASGQSYHDHVARNIVGPLGLDHTTSELSADHLGEHATGYSSLAYAERRFPIEHVTTAAMASATGFSSTARDLVRYAAAHFTGDSRLISDDSKRLMQHVEWEVGGGAGSYGLGLGTAEIAGRRVFGHGGGYPGHITRTWFDPADRLAVSVLTNAIDGPALGLANAVLRIVELAVGAQPDPAAPTITPARFRGRFANLWGAFDVVDLGGCLFQIDATAPDPGADPVRLEIVDEHTVRFTAASGYRSPGELLHYEFDASGTSVRSVRGGSAMTSYPLDAYRAAAGGRERVGPGASLRPGA